MAEHGATVEELKAVFGWTNDQMPSLYTKSANREKIAARAAHKMIGEDHEHFIPAPSIQVRERGQITK
jgi:23S rRNA U2552 (ribose-2'-O)-methylase RlmE/FtsJ